MKIRSESPETTREIAALLAAVSVPGDLIVLAGDMGAGKTCFAGGFAHGLGINDRITSPTFTLVNTYDGRVRLHHLDVYRLEQIDEVLDLALPELLGAVSGAMSEGQRKEDSGLEQPRTFLPDGSAEPSPCSG